jgi:drug/metabolite transporter (DMT)-like permease
MTTTTPSATGFAATHAARPRRWLGPLFLGAAALAWSGNHVIARAIAGSVPVWSLNLVRWCLVASIIAVFGHRALKRDWPLLVSNLPVLIFLGAVGGGLFGTTQYVALQHTTVINMGVMNSIAPALIIGASFALFGDRVSWLQTLGILTSLAGVVVIISRLDAARLLALEFNAGDLLIFGNMVMWGVYSACLRLRPPVSVTSFLFVLAVVAACTNLPMAFVELARGEELDFTDAATAGAIAYMALFSSITAYLCWSRGIEIMGTARASAFLHLIPVFGATLGYLILSEPLEVYHAAGFALILAGVTLASRKQAA